MDEMLRPEELKALLLQGYLFARPERGFKSPKW